MHCIWCSTCVILDALFMLQYIMERIEMDKYHWRWNLMIVKQHALWWREKSLPSIERLWERPRGKGPWQFGVWEKKNTCASSTFIEKTFLDLELFNIMRQSLRFGRVCSKLGVLSEKIRKWWNVQGKKLRDHSIFVKRFIAECNQFVENEIKIGTKLVRDSSGKITTWKDLFWSSWRFSLVFSSLVDNKVVYISREVLQSKGKPSSFRSTKLHVMG